MKYQWFALSPYQIFTQLSTNKGGLSSAEAKRRLQRYGPNALPESRGDSLPTIFFRQFQSPLIYVLIISAIAIYALGEATDAAIILFVLIFNSIIGTIQEGRAQNTLQALNKLAKTTSTVIRDGEEQVLPDEELVPGDIILLNEGQRIPADARIIKANNLSIEEASLTGESVPIYKSVELPGQKSDSTRLTLGDQRTMVFRGTFIATGNGMAVVVTTGKETEIGKIAQSVQSISTDIPLKRAVERLTHQIIWVMAVISVAILSLGLVRGYDLREMFTTVVSLAVSAILEGLPIVLTLVLATGVWRMGRRNALVKKLNAVEALGQATIIAVDKTGTITRNQLMVSSVFLNGKEYQVTGAGYEPIGQIQLGEKIITAKQAIGELLLTAHIAVANTTAQLFRAEKTQAWQVIGDPTEAALLVFGQKLGVTREQIDTPIADLPFDYNRKYRATITRYEKRNLLSVTGAPEQVMALCTLSATEKETLNTTLTNLSRQGQRVVAFAYQYDITEIPQQPTKLTFGGFFGMSDVLHSEISQTVALVNKAGISVVMITGDHKETAETIARQAGIFHDGDRLLTGNQIETLSLPDLANQLDGVRVFARVTPEHKQKIIEAYRLRGDVVAMTGDGVNDAPPLVAADLGLAMGISGTEVAKEAADIVLLDDNFKSIAAAVEEGRSIYRTIKKVIAYLFATSAGEILVVAVALALGLPMPVTAAQIIWLNLVTDGFLDVSLAMEPKDKNILSEKWSKEAKSLIDSIMLQRILLFAVVMAIGTLALLGSYEDYDTVRLGAIALTVMAAFQWFNAWNSRSARHSVFSQNPLANPYLIGATVIVVVLQMAALHLPFLQSILRTTPLTLNEWVICIAVASSALWVEELRKIAARLFNR